MAVGYIAWRTLAPILAPLYFDRAPSSDGTLGFHDVMYIVYVLYDVFLLVGTVVGGCVGYRMGWKTLDRPRPLPVSAPDDAVVWPPAPKTPVTVHEGADVKIVPL
jgi:hypothetical protein